MFGIPLEGGTDGRVKASQPLEADLGFVGRCGSRCTCGPFVCTHSCAGAENEVCLQGGKGDIGRCPAWGRVKRGEAAIRGPSAWGFADTVRNGPSFAEPLEGALVAKREADPVIKGVAIAAPFAKKDASFLGGTPKGEGFPINKDKVKISVMEVPRGGSKRKVPLLES